MSDSGEHWQRRTVLEGIAGLGLLGVAGITAADPERPPGPKPREVLVGAAAKASTNAVASAVKSAVPSEANIVHRNPVLGYLAVELPDAQGVPPADHLDSAIGDHPAVQYVEPNKTYKKQVAPNDPDYDRQYAPQQVNADTAWETTQGSEDVTIAVIDTGVQYDHPDLASQFGSDKGRDFLDDDSDPGNESGNHATHVSGCASATTDNSTGVAGVSDSRLVSARVLGESGGSTSDIADAIQWAADMGVDLINMSLGGGGYTQTLKDAVSYADNAGVLQICAAGNDGSYGVSYPAKYEECMAVSAIDPDENLARFSNYGPAIDLAAPGVNVYSTYPTDDYRELSGTSMACPVTTGVAALAKAANPDLSKSELRSRLTNTAVDIGLSEDAQGAGRVDAANAVSGDDGGGGGGGGDPDLFCGTATNAEHAAADRAFPVWGDYYYYAVGSQEYLGVYPGSETTLKETSEGFYEEVASC